LQLPAGEFRGERLGVHEPLVRLDVDVGVRALELGDVLVEDLAVEGLGFRWLAVDRDRDLAARAGLVAGPAGNRGGGESGDEQGADQATWRCVHLRALRGGPVWWAGWVGPVSGRLAVENRCSE